MTKFLAPWAGGRRAAAPDPNATTATPDNVARILGSRSAGQRPGLRATIVAKLRGAGYLPAEGGEPNDAAVLNAVDHLRADQQAGRAKRAEDAAYAEFFPGPGTTRPAGLPEDPEAPPYQAFYPNGS